MRNNPVRQPQNDGRFSSSVRLETNDRQWDSLDYLTIKSIEVHGTSLHVNVAAAKMSLSALLQRATIDDHEEIVNACDVALKQSKGDVEAQRIKCIALLKLERYEDALQVLEQAGENVKQKSQLERAYALYKNGDLQLAKEVARSTAERGARHVEAQASYRLEEFEAAASLYKNLAESQAAIENETNDLRINSGATQAQLEWQGNGHLVEKKKPSREDLEAFEMAYNAACASIARRELRQAEVLLRSAKDLCNSLDELSEQEKATEVTTITVQQLYTSRRLGKTEEFEKLASEVDLQEIPDLTTKQIAQNNKLASAANPPNPYLAQRLFESVTDLPKSEKLFQFQADLIEENSLALELLALKYIGVVQSTTKLLSSSSPTISSHENNISVLNAAAHAQYQLGKLGLKQIIPLVEQRPNDIGLVLTIIQLYILTNNPGSATTVLESLLKRLADSSSPVDQDILFAPGLIATLVSLYNSQNRKSQIQTTLAKAASYWRHKSKPPVPLLETAGLALLKSQDLEHQSLALEIFSTLRSLDPNSRLATAGYVAAHTLTSSDSSAPPPETNTLTPVPRLTAGIDAAVLEAMGIPSLTPDPTTSAAQTSRKRALDEKPKPVKKRVRKSRLPKSFDPAKLPDPERWLPLRDRTSYKPKGKKGRQKAAALTQGGVSTGAEKGGDAGGTASGSGPGKGASEGVIKAGNAPVKSKKKKGKK